MRPPPQRPSWHAKASKLCGLRKHNFETGAGRDSRISTETERPSNSLPYFALVALAVGLQYLQMNQMNKRNPATQANKQMATLQKFMPILFAYIYFLIPAAVLIYMIVSTLIRIGTQDIIFRTGVVTPLTAGQTSLPKASSVADDKPSPAPAGSKGKQTAPNASKDPETPKPQPNPTTRSKNKRKRKDR